MPTRGRIPPLFLVFLVAFVLLGLVGFQIVKERKIASATIRDKEFELDHVTLNLEEQSKLVREREKERDSLQAKFVELEHLSQTAQNALEIQLASMRSQMEKAVEELSEAKKSFQQKEDEIVQIRQQLQDISFEKAKESAEQITNSAVDPMLENQQAEEHKRADEAGLDERKRLQDEEEASKDGDVAATEQEMTLRATKDGDVSATEQEMDERSKPKGNVSNEGAVKTEEAKDDETVDNIDVSSRLGARQEWKLEEHANEDIRLLDGIETQEEDLHEIAKLDEDLQTENHEDTDAQEADHNLV